MNIKRVCCGIILEDRRVLIARRNDVNFKGLWEFPGGKVMEGESDKACLERELMEELNIKTQAGDFFCEVFHSYSGFEIHLLAYYAKIEQGKPKLSEHSEIEWVSFSDLNNYNFLVADIPIVDKLSKLY